MPKNVSKILIIQLLVFVNVLLVNKKFANLYFFILIINYNILAYFITVN